MTSSRAITTASLLMLGIAIASLVAAFSREPEGFDVAPVTLSPDDLDQLLAARVAADSLANDLASPDDSGRVAMLFANRARAQRIETSLTDVIGPEMQSPTPGDRSHEDERPLWIKLIVTAALGLSALWVVLSGRYDDETRKWAFGLLSLIAGVWIGTAT